MTRPALPTRALTAWRERLRSRLDQMTPRQRQYALLTTLLGGGIGLLWLVFSLSSTAPNSKAIEVASAQSTSVTNIGVLPPGAQVNPVDQWVGNAGRKLAQYESEREEQGRLNKDRQTFEARTMQRFSELEQRLTSAQQGAALSIAPAGHPPQFPASPAPRSIPPAVPAAPSDISPDISPDMPPDMPPGMPPAMPPGTPPRMLPGTPPGIPSALPSAIPRGAQFSPPSFGPALVAAPLIVRVSLAPAPTVTANPEGRETPSGVQPGKAAADPADLRTVSTFLPVSFTRGTLLGGLDAPTGGQSQSNPHPVLIRLSDNSVLPNRFRGEYRDCFVVAAGYGDISAERAYLRTESLSCVRDDGATLEVRIQGTVYGEDGKVGMRGRLVTKQGQMLANALLAGVVSGIGQGLSTANTSYSSSPLGTTASTDSSVDAYRAGLGSGVGKALDRLAQYYIKLAENTFPVIEVDAGREIDVVITKGVRIEVPMSSPTTARANSPGDTDAEREDRLNAGRATGTRGGAPRFPAPETRYLEASKDELY